MGIGAVSSTSSRISASAADTLSNLVCVLSEICYWLRYAIKLNAVPGCNQLHSTWLSSMHRLQLPFVVRNNLYSGTMLIRHSNRQLPHTVILASCAQSRECAVPVAVRDCLSSMMQWVSFTRSQTMPQPQHCLSKLSFKHEQRQRTTESWEPAVILIITISKIAFPCLQNSDRTSTRLSSSESQCSSATFHCLVMVLGQLQQCLYRTSDVGKLRKLCRTYHASRTIRLCSAICNLTSRFEAFSELKMRHVNFTTIYWVIINNVQVLYWSLEEDNN